MEMIHSPQTESSPMAAYPSPPLESGLFCRRREEAGSAGVGGQAVRSPGASGEGSLGTTYQIASPPQEEGLVRRLERWHLQAIARRVLEEERVATCLRRIRPLMSGVSVWKGEKAAHYTGLIVCGSVWNCPICAAKISEGRRVDLREGISRWRKRGGQVLHLVQTVPHYSFQPLREVLEGFMKARMLQRHRKPWLRMVKEISLAGIVRGLEVTWGQNGWHVHSHELVYVKSGWDDIQDLEARVKPMWESACMSAGLGRPNERGVVIQDGSYADRYAAKWGLESEVTKGHTKAGRDGNFSPWDLLRAIGKGVTEWEGLFREYAKAFKGRHQLEWSKGLRELLELDKEESDADLAGRLEDDAEFLGLIGPEVWAVVLRREKRGEVLEVAHREGWPGVVNLIRKLSGGWKDGKGMEFRARSDNRNKR